MSHAKYLSCIFNREKQDRMIEKIKADLADFEDKYDGFIVSGVGGMLGAVLARELNKSLVVVRKADDSHSGYEIENLGHWPIRLIYLDDLVATGTTLRRVLSKAKKENEKFSLAGILLYSNYQLALTPEKINSIMDDLPTSYKNELIDLGVIEGEKPNNP